MVCRDLDVGFTALYCSYPRSTLGAWDLGRWSLCSGLWDYD